MLEHITQIVGQFLVIHFGRHGNPDFPQFTAPQQNERLPFGKRHNIRW
jgi:hypothetical protein